MVIRANVAVAAQIVRDRVAKQGLALAVVRNPVPASFLITRAAPGALNYAVRLGRILLRNLRVGIDAILAAVAGYTGGHTIARGRVMSTVLRENRGFTLGSIVIGTPDAGKLTIAVCNEYMIALSHGVPLAAFPDLITVFDCTTGLPLASSEVAVGRPVAVLVVPRRHLLLGATMRDLTLLRPIEALLGVRFPRSRSVLRTPDPAPGQ
jgi:DUF917 family protein